MSDKEARVLAAGDTIEVNGREFKLSPIGMQQLHEVQRAAVDNYKREYLRTYAQNIDLLPEAERGKVLEQKLEEVARWDIGNLPQKQAYDVRLLPITDKLNEWMAEEHGRDAPTTDNSKRAAVGTALDSGKLKPMDVEKMTGSRPRSVKIPFDSWWVTATYDGMVTFICASLGSGGQKITKDEVMKWPLAKVMEAARKVEQVTAPALGNT